MKKKNLHKLKNIYLNKSSNVEFSLMPCGIAKKKKEKKPNLLIRNLFKYSNLSLLMIGTEK